MKQYKYSLSEIDKMLRQMVVLTDSRERENKHITDYLTKCGIKYEKTTLQYGDYSFYLPKAATGSNDIFFHDTVSIERKATLEELSGNLTQKREQFEREFLRARNEGCKIYMMVENPGGYGDIIEHRYNTQFEPKSFIGSLQAFESRYNVNVRFISKEHAGYFMCNIFRFTARELLK